MKRKLLLFFVIVMMIISLCACGQSGAEVDLDNTVYSTDGLFAMNTPDGWTTYDAPDSEGLVMAITDNDTAFAKIYFYDIILYDYPLDLCLEDVKNYYGENIIGDVEEIEVDGMKAYKLQNSMVDISEDGEELNYHGYEYVIDTPIGVVEIDIHYAQYKLEGKIFDPSEDELKLLHRICESFTVISE